MYIHNNNNVIKNIYIIIFMESELINYTSNIYSHLHLPIVFNVYMY